MSHSCRNRLLTSSLSQAKSLQEQLNVSLAVIERLEGAAEEQAAEIAERRSALETSLEEAQVQSRPSCGWNNLLLLCNSARHGCITTHSATALEETVVPAIGLLRLYFSWWHPSQKSWARPLECRLDCVHIQGEWHTGGAIASDRSDSLCRIDSLIAPKSNAAPACRRRRRKPGEIWST